MSSLPPALRAYVGLVAGLGLTVTAAAVPALGALDARTALLAALAVGCATRTVPVPGAGVALTAETPFLLALVDDGHGPLAILAAAAGQALATVAHGTWRRPHTVPFNAGAGALGTLLAAAVHHAAAPLFAPVPTLLAGLAAFLGTSAVVVGAVRLASGRMPAQGWRDGVPLTCAAYVASASLGHILVSSGALVSALLLVAPLGILVHQTYLAHRDRVQERVSHETERDTLFLPTLEALIAAIEARDPAAHGHNQRVRTQAIGLAYALGHDDEATLLALRYGAILHDIGRIAIPDRLLHATGPLSPEDLQLVRRHASIGCDLVRHVPFPPGVLEVVRSHHERWDGAGYPDGLAGQAIPLPARLVAVCDAYDDLCSGGWRPAATPEEALRVIEQDAGTAFDPQIALGFVRWMRDQETPEHARTPSISEASAEISMLSHEQARLVDLAHRDELTSLRNGRGLQRDLAIHCEGGRPFVLLMLDLDGFKGINDHLGHDVGDRALRIVGEALTGLPAPRAVYRNGGDEFVVIVPGSCAPDEEAELARAAIESRALPVEGGHVPLRTSVGGVAVRAIPAAEALRQADQAMFAVKAARKAQDPRPRGAPPTVVRGEGTVAV